jgi:hypothetical protein
MKHYTVYKACNSILISQHILIVVLAYMGMNRTRRDYLAQPGLSPFMQYGMPNVGASLSSRHYFHGFHICDDQSRY